MLMHMKRTFPWAQLGYIHRRLRSALVRHGELENILDVTR